MKPPWDHKLSISSCHTSYFEVEWRIYLNQYLNQCWNIANWILMNKPQWNFNRNYTFPFRKMLLKCRLRNDVRLVSASMCFNERYSLHVSYYFVWRFLPDWHWYYKKKSRTKFNLCFPPWLLWTEFVWYPMKSTGYLLNHPIIVVDALPMLRSCILWSFSDRNMFQ